MSSEVSSEVALLSSMHGEHEDVWMDEERSRRRGQVAVSPERRLVSMKGACGVLHAVVACLPMVGTGVATEGGHRLSTEGADEGAASTNPTRNEASHYGEMPELWGMSELTFEVRAVTRSGWGHASVRAEIGRRSGDRRTKEYGGRRARRHRAGERTRRTCVGTCPTEHGVVFLFCGAVPRDDVSAGADPHDGGVVLFV